jgi:ABC-type multidrug transport system fused ATPase/permease subunit
VIRTAGKAWKLLDAGERRGALVVIALAVLTALFEVVGIASVVPFLRVLADPGIVERTPALAGARDALGVASLDDFLVVLGLGAFAALLLATVVRTVGQYALTRFAQGRRHSLGQRLLSHYLHQPYVFHLGRHSSDLAKTILSEVDQAVANVYQPLAMLIAKGFTLLAVIALLLAVDPWVALAAAAVLGGCYAVIYLVVRGVLGRIGGIRADANRGRFEATGEALAGIKEIKLRGSERLHLERFSAPSRRVAQSLTTGRVLGEVPRFAVEAVAFGGILGLALVLHVRHGGHEGGALGEVIPLLGLYAFAGYRMLPAVQGIYQAVSQIRFGQAAVDALHAELHAAPAPPHLPARAPAPLPLRDRLALEGVSYGYPGGSGAGIRGIDLELPAGGSLGVVGPTGAGKTTLVDVILGLLVPQEGTMRVDGVPVTDANRGAWQANIGYVPQDIFLFDATIAENIAFAVPGERIDMDRVRAVARLARIERFVETELAEGYATRVGERGVRLSGGQRQRVGIARALYHDPEVIVFDEATSALDTLTEREVMAAVGMLSELKTVIMIAHRLSTVQACDRILVLEGGRRAGYGSYDALVRGNDIFRRMAEAQ